MMLKKNSKQLIFLIIGIIISIFSGFFINILFLNNKPLIPQNNSEAMEEGIYTISENISINLANAYKKNGTKSDDLVEDIYGKKQNLSNIIKSKTKLVLQYSELNCNVCVDSALMYFMQFAKNIGEENVILIVKYNNSNYLNQFVRLNHIKLTHLYKFIDTHDAQPGYIDEDPHLFILKNDLYRRDVFFPMKEFPVFSKTYYHVILNKYFIRK